jgi:hypothetical protein
VVVGNENISGNIVYATKIPPPRTAILIKATQIFLNLSIGSGFLVGGGVSVVQDVSGTVDREALSGGVPMSSSDKTDCEVGTVVGSDSNSDIGVVVDSHSDVGSLTREISPRGVEVSC